MFVSKRDTIQWHVLYNKHFSTFKVSNTVVSREEAHSRLGGWIMHCNLFQSSKARTRKISLPHPPRWQNIPDFLRSSLKASCALTQREIYENNRESGGTCLQKDPGASCCALPLFKESAIEMNLCDQKLLIFACTTGEGERMREEE